MKERVAHPHLQINLKFDPDGCCASINMAAWSCQLYAYSKGNQFCAISGDSVVLMRIHIFFAFNFFFLII